MYRRPLAQHERATCRELWPLARRYFLKNYITIDMLVELMKKNLSTVGAELRGGILTEGTIETAFYIKDGTITYERQVRRPDKICLLCYNI